MKEVIERCDLCGRSDDEVMLYDTLGIGVLMRICERCSLIENLPILKRPSVEQLKNSEKPFSVKERLLRIGKFVTKEKKSTINESLKKLNEHPELEKPEQAKFKLIDNFHWKIMISRRRKGFTVKQLASALNESETAINLLEKGIIPGNSFTLVKKLEQFFNLELIKKNFIEIIREDELKKMRKERYVSWEKNSEPKIITVEKLNEDRIRKSEEKIAKEEKLKDKESEDMLDKIIATETNTRTKGLDPISFRSKVFDFEQAKKNNLTISELNRIHQKIEADFSKKSKEEVGKEQFEGFGKEDEKVLMKSVMREYKKKPGLKQIQRGEVPSIYDLMKIKEEKDKTSLTGKDIQLVEENKQ